MATDDDRGAITMDEQTRIETIDEALEAHAAGPEDDEAELGDAGKVIDPICAP